MAESDRDLTINLQLPVDLTKETKESSKQLNEPKVETPLKDEISRRHPLVGGNIWGRPSRNYEDIIEPFSRRLWLNEFINGCLCIAMGLIGAGVFAVTLWAIAGQSAITLHDEKGNPLDAATQVNLIAINSGVGLAKALLAVAFAKYCFQIVRVCLSELNRLSERKHSLWMGQIYIASVQKCTWEGLQDALSDYGKSNKSIAKDLSPSDIDVDLGPGLSKIGQSAADVKKVFGK